MQNFNWEFTLCIFEIGDHPTVVKCLMIAAESFRWKSGFKWKSSSVFQMDGRKLGQVQRICILWIVLGRCCWAAKSLTRLQSGLRQNSLPNKTLDKFETFQSLLAESQEHHSLRSAIQTLDSLRFQSFLLSESEINIPARCHTYLECWQHVVNATNINQSYSCVVRATCYSNSLA